MYCLVRLEAGFWDDITSLWEAGELPHNFWTDSVWLWRAEKHRVDQERFSIASFYRLGQDRGNTLRYERPDRFWLAQQQWVKWGLEKAMMGDTGAHVCLSTLGAWKVAMRLRDKEALQEVVGLSGVYGREVSLEELHSELPSKWQVHVPTEARAQRAASTGIHALLQPFATRARRGVNALRRQFATRSCQSEVQGVHTGRTLGYNGIANGTAGSPARHDVAIMRAPCTILHGQSSWASVTISSSEKPTFLNIFTVRLVTWIYRCRWVEACCLPYALAKPWKGLLHLPLH